MSNKKTDKSTKEYKTFEEFYPFYLGEHSNTINRRLHLTGTTLSLMILVYTILTLNFANLYYVPLVGYSFAWIGHFFFEKNKPATFKYPWMSFKGDLKLWYEVVTGVRRF